MNPVDSLLYYRVIKMIVAAVLTAAYYLYIFFSQQVSFLGASFRGNSIRNVEPFLG